MANDIILPPQKSVEIPKPIEDAVDEFDYLKNADKAKNAVTSIFTDLLVGNNVYLYGRAGTGKTTLAKKIVNFLLKRETFVINCNQFTSPIDIIGGQTIEGYKQGRLVQAWETGGVLILDELPKLDPNTAGLLNEALAESAAKVKKYGITSKEYDKYKKIKDDAGKREVGFSIEKDGDLFFRTDYPTITDGRGIKIRKHKNFACIGTGNTNLKEISQNFSGNNRQDYSLVDRFAGSFYEIDYDVALEKDLTYTRVYEVAKIIRDILDADKNSIESVSLRTMLNFNRIYEQEGLRKIRSKYAYLGIVKKNKAGNWHMYNKTLLDSVLSFIDTLPDATKDLCEKSQIFILADTSEIKPGTKPEDISSTPIDTNEFIKDWHKIHGEEISPEADTNKLLIDFQEKKLPLFDM